MEFKRDVTMLLCSDVAHARDFYAEHLGLEVTADLGWFVGMQRVGRPKEDYELSLCAHEHDSIPAPIRRPTDGLVLAFEVDDCDALHDAMNSSGVTILAPPADELWGQRHFFAQAPDGVALDIFHAIPPDPEWMRANGFA